MNHVTHKLQSTPSKQFHRLQKLDYFLIVLLTGEIGYILLIILVGPVGFVFWSTKLGFPNNAAYFFGDMSEAMGGLLPVMLIANIIGAFGGLVLRLRSYQETQNDFGDGHLFNWIYIVGTVSIIFLSSLIPRY